MRDEFVLDLVRTIPDVIWGVIIGSSISGLVTVTVEVVKSRRVTREDRKARIYAVEDALQEATLQFQIAIGKQDADPDFPIDQHHDYFRAINQFLVLKRRLDDGTLAELAEGYSQTMDAALERVIDPKLGFFGEKVNDVHAYHGQILDRLKALTLNMATSRRARFRRWSRDAW